MVNVHGQRIHMRWFRPYVAKFYAPISTNIILGTYFTRLSGY